jgi:hypothetical protein
VDLTGHQALIFVTKQLDDDCRQPWFLYKVAALLEYRLVLLFFCAVRFPREVG